jgi:hypothetical protein
LSKLLKKLIGDLKKENAEFTPAMLSKIKSFNNDFALSKNPISEAFLYQKWLDIASNDDGNSPVLKPLNSIVVYTAEIEKEKSFLDSELLEITIFSKLTEIEKSGKPLQPERARRLSSDMPLNPITTMTPAPQSTPIKGSSTQSTPRATSSTSSPKYIRRIKWKHVLVGVGDDSLTLGECFCDHDICVFASGSNTCKHS